MSVSQKVNGGGKSVSYIPELQSCLKHQGENATIPELYFLIYNLFLGIW